MSTVHIVGAGIAGLAAAVRLVDAGRQVFLHEASINAGGRCRSFHDSTLDCTIDNGNHLLLSGNWSTRAFLAEIGASDTLTGPAEAQFPFVDVTSGERWTVSLGTSRIPWRILRAGCRPPGTRIGDFLSILRLARASPDATVASLFEQRSVFYKHFLQPLAIAALNTPLDKAAAAPLWQVFRETFARGGSACRPLVARDGLSDSFITPALAHLRTRGGELQFNRRLKAIETEADRAIRLEFGNDEIELSPDTMVVLAIPPASLNTVLTDLPIPRGSHAIVNVHYKASRPPPFAEKTPILGVINGVAEWLFLRGTVISVTISAADVLAEMPAADIAKRVWSDIIRALDINEAMPPYRVVKERRATFSQTPDAMRLRLGTCTNVKNLFLAGDWTDTGLPATIESAIRSGHKAAAAIMAAP